MRISAHAVSTAIRDSIVDGSFPPGARLTEELLARRYGISRVPVREALRTLESEGFVVTRRHAGAFVAEPGEHEAADLLDVRALLEPLGAARAAQRRTQAHLKVLRGLVRLAHGRIEQGHLSDLRSLDGWFHETLAHATGSPSLAALLIQLRRKLVWLRALDVEPRGAQRPGAGAAFGGAAGTAPGPTGGTASPGTAKVPGERGEERRRTEAAWREHAAMADAVARGDAERARALATAAVERSAVLVHLPSQGPRSAGPGKAQGGGGDAESAGNAGGAKKGQRTGNSGDAGEGGVRRRKPPLNTPRARM